MKLARFALLAALLIAGPALADPGVPVAGSGGSGGSGGSVTQGTVPWVTALNTTPTLANGNGVVPTQGGTALSATNGAFTNLLQGNAVLATSNPIFITGSGTAGSAAVNPITVQGIASMTPIQAALNTTPSLANGNGVVPTQGGSVLSTTNGSYSNLLQGNAVLATTNPIFTTPVPTTTGGLTTFFVQPAASNNSTNIKASAGQVYWVLVENNSATVNYLRFYNTASAPTCTSATNLVFQMQIPASTSVGGVNVPLHFGVPFSSGIGICVTSGYATTDNTNATATAISLTIGYN